MALDGFDPDFEDFPDYILKVTECIWEGRDAGSISRYHAPDCIVHTGMGSTAGVRAAVESTLQTQHQFPEPPDPRQGRDLVWAARAGTAVVAPFDE